MLIKIFILIIIAGICIYNNINTITWKENVVDPVTAFGLASTAFGAIKTAFEHGREIESMIGDIGRWTNAVYDLEAAFDHLADVFRRTMDMKRIYELLGI